MFPFSIYFSHSLSLSVSLFVFSFPFLLSCICIPPSCSLSLNNSFFLSQFLHTHSLSLCSFIHLCVCPSLSLSIYLSHTLSLLLSLSLCSSSSLFNLQMPRSVHICSAKRHKRESPESGSRYFWPPSNIFASLIWLQVYTLRLIRFSLPWYYLSWGQLFWSPIGHETRFTVPMNSIVKDEVEYWSIWPCDYTVKELHCLKAIGKVGLCTK